MCGTTLPTQSSAGAGPLSSSEVAARAGCDERHVREWLCNQVAGGYLHHDAGADTYELPPEQELALADESLWQFRRTLLQALTKPKVAAVELARQFVEYVEEAGKESAALPNTELGPWTET